MTISSDLLAMRMRRPGISCLCIVIISLVCIIGIILHYTLQRRSMRQYIHMADVIRYGNNTLARRRIPRIIHQTYRTSHIPLRWNKTVQSVIMKNANEFQYQLWNDEDRDAFVQEKEFYFYQHTYTKYPYNIQRVDAFRYILMFYLGGIYSDMDNGCNRAYKELVATVESLDPDASHLAAFPALEGPRIDIDFIISTPGHPIFKQMISRLPRFNHYFLLPFWTVFISTGPIFATIQEHFFKTSENESVRVIDADVFRPYFSWKENGGTWFTSDTKILFAIGPYEHILINSFIILLIGFVVLKGLVYCINRRGLSRREQTWTS